MDPGVPRHGADARLRELQHGTTIEAALDFYDSLDAVRVEELTGSWRGEDLPTGNPFDGLLGRLGWHGKRFDGPDEVHPLVFHASAGRLRSINPVLVPLALGLRHPRLLHAPFTARVFPVIRPLMSTRKPKARLRMMRYRGVETATMCYDDLPINDAFRRVDADALVGAMDLRGLDPPFMFVLRRT